MLDLARLHGDFPESVTTENTLQCVEQKLMEVNDYKSFYWRIRGVQELFSVNLSIDSSKIWTGKKQTSIAVVWNILKFQRVVFSASVNWDLQSGICMYFEQKKAALLLTGCFGSYYFGFVFNSLCATVIVNIE